MNPFTLFSPAYAQGADGVLTNLAQSPLAPFIFIVPAFYFIFLRPQQQKQKEMREMLATLKRGDKVITGGGILGVVQKVPIVQSKSGKQVASSEIEVEIAPNLRVTVLRETITSVIKPMAAGDAKPEKEKVL